MVSRYLIYCCCLLHLVNVTAGNDVILFNEEKELNQEDDIDTLLMGEQMFKSDLVPVKKSSQLSKSTKNRSTQSSATTKAPPLNSTTPPVSSLGHEPLTTHNCSQGDEKRSAAGGPLNASVQLKWQSLDSAAELEGEDDLLGDMDYQFLPVMEESVFHRARRQAQDITSGQNIYLADLVIGNRTLTQSESTEGTLDHQNLNNSIANFLTTYLNKAIPGKTIDVQITNLGTKSGAQNTTVSFEIQIASIFSEDMRQQIAMALDALDKEDNFQQGGHPYSTRDVRLGTLNGEEKTLEYVVCILCPVYQTCGLVNDEWTCQLSDNRLYAFGEVQGDSTMTKGAAFSTAEVKVPDGIAWNQEEVNNIWISMNGLLSFDSEYAGYIPYRLPVRNRKLLAVYWSDLFLRPSDPGEVYHKVYTKYGIYDEKIFNKANSDVMTHAGVNSFDAKSVVVVTWSNLSPYFLQAGQSERVTFQCAIISDGTTTYAVYYYGQAAMRFSPSLQRPVEVGWGDMNLGGSWNNYYIFDRVLGNTGQPGKWFFELGRRENYRMKCMNWYQENLQEIETIRRWDVILPQCPCNEFFAWSTGWWFKSSQDSVNCYESFNAFLPYGRTCCYRTDDWLLNWSSLRWMLSVFGRTFGTFENRIPSAGHLQRKSPFYGGNYGNYWYHDSWYGNAAMYTSSWFGRETEYGYQHELDDLEPKQWCCVQSNLCHLYYQVRPMSTCVGSSVVFGFGFGDPQINTLDNRWFPFNAIGEFRLLEISGKNPRNVSQSIDFKFQGRTCPLANASVWCGLALKTTNNNTARVEISESGNIMIIYVNGQDYTLRFRDNVNFTAVDKDIYLRKENESLKMSTTDGVGLTVTLKLKLLLYTVDIDEVYRSMTKGLLGNFNNDSSDDFIFPNGTKLANNSSEREIFNYGQTWAVNDQQSLFEYILGQNTSTFSKPNIPFFLDEAGGAAKAEAEQFCNSSSNLACILDFMATRDPLIAKLSKESSDMIKNQILLVGNNAPVISGNRDLYVTVNSSLKISLVCSDADRDTIIVYILSQPREGFTYTYTNATGVLDISYTPTGIHNDTIEIVALDSKGLDSGVYKANITLCSGCSNNGLCDPSELQRVNTPYYSVASCVCNVGYAGDHCEMDRDGCSVDPCPYSTRCVDLIASVEAVTGVAFQCSDCPAGYHLVLNQTKCEDIDECKNTSNPCHANAKCQNTIGSYECTCYPGYRKFNKECLDINECTEYQHDCDQICINQLSTFTCDCYEGFTKSGGVLRHGCLKTAQDPCQSFSKTCSYGCRNQSGTPECYCESGMELAADKQTCIDIDECKVNLCPQGCENSMGSYQCTCFDGFYSSQGDNLTCEACPDNKYGPDCRKDCQCSGRAEKCDSVKGCVCEPGWTGEKCGTDLDECATNATACPGDQICVNSVGSYTCGCPTGYELTNRTCTDIDECAKVVTSNCSQVCINTRGSYVCRCRDGYKASPSGVCTDIDECGDSTNGCQHKCLNLEGSFNCECHPGYVLKEDRKSCQKVVDPCLNSNISCSFGCSLINNTAQCFCPIGYVLGSDKTSCHDIDECSDNSGRHGKCTDQCTNTNGSYSCSCPVGKMLLLDKRTCEECDPYHWGEDCSKDCGCYPIGSEKCDPVLGCICKQGWAGVDCKADVDECDFRSSLCPPSSVCVDTPGSYKCECLDGFELASDKLSCIDIDECAVTKPCDHNCTNTVGAFQCSCYEGFRLDGVKCRDIDECAVPTLNKCDQLCRNTAGGFACECNAGFVLNITSRNTCNLADSSKACNSTSLCNQVCTSVGGKDVCSCHQGYHLNVTDNASCTDVNECSGISPCVNGQCTNTDGAFNCTCSPGRALAADRLTCQVCAEDSYGINCSSKCTCNVTNTESCSATDGTCQCRDGWEGQDCSKDINECLKSPCYANSQCVNSPGSYRCVCEVGYYSTGDNCSVCDSTRYGQDCSESCKCEFPNTLSCNRTNGQCNCMSGWTGDRCNQDVDECGTNSSYCSGNFTRCVNLNGSAECGCLEGYEQSTISNSCQDINECLNPQLNKCLSPAICNNTVGAYECICMEGFQYVSGQCIGCDSTHYGQNCTYTCSCNTTNTADCYDVNGTCTCNHGWTGANCDVDIDECVVNSTYCTNLHEKCHNLNGSAECICEVGFHKPNNTITCQACDSNHYGPNCASPCSCNTTNTADCNDVTGTCTCKPGWNGTNCDQACNSTHYGQDCASPCSCNTTNTADCNDVNGTCTCKPGWNGTNCDQACDSTHFGQDCASTCSCNTTNTADCNDVSGTCTCKPGWNGTTCNQGCDSTHYGINCGTVCSCSLANTLDCNDTNGSCVCKSGWTGTLCNQDVDECAMNLNYCQGANEACNNLQGGAECICKVGFYKPRSGAVCQACDTTHYGQNCSSLCTCSMPNTIDCNDETGACTCRSDWTGVRCDQQDTCNLLSPCVSDFYAFGPQQVDYTMQKNAEYASSRLYVSDGISYGQDLVTFVSISVNGMVTLNEDFNSYSPQNLIYSRRKMLAPYWADLEVYYGDIGEVYYQAYSKYGRYEPTIFNKANNDVRGYAGNYEFDASNVIVITWYNVIAFPAWNAQYERVTFQCTIISDGFTTYIVYTYGQRAMKFNPALLREVEVGWGFTNLDVSKLNYYNFDKVRGNTGENGKWFFQIGQRENYRKKCINWYQRNMYSYQEIMYWDSALPKCPCSEYFAQVNGWWFTSLEYGDFCYQSYIPYYQAGRKCCYRRDGWLLTWWQMSNFFILTGIYDTRMPIAGSLQLWSPYYNSYYGSYWYINSYYGNTPLYGNYWYYGSSFYASLHQQEDEDPKRWCCELSDQCYLYYQARPSSFCMGSTFYYGYMFGDPHIMTLDERSFIFNGVGEYIILEVEGVKPGNGTLTGNFEIQGRTCRATNAQGNLTDATAWCALAMRTISNSTVRVDISLSGDSLIIYANDQDYTMRFRENVNFTAVDRDVNMRKDNDSLRITTLDDIGLTISLSNRILQFTVSIQEKYRNKTRGLLGNFNGDKTDDFIFPNGTMLPNNSSERVLYEYGKTWAVTDVTSLFQYVFGQNASTVSDPSFIPIFLDEVNATVRAEAEKICGGATNLPCIFDYIATRNPDIALSSKAAAQTFIDQNIFSANRVPECSGPSEFNVTFNQTKTFQLNCSDADSDTLSLQTISQPSGGFNITFNTSTGVMNIIYTPARTLNGTLQLAVVDAKGASSEVYVAKFTVCSGCSQHGDCDFSEQINRVSPYYSVASCDCHTGYTGTDCATDKDGCADNPCPLSNNCTDIPADEEKLTLRAFKCGTCTVGYELIDNGTKCEDIDECNSTRSPCGANTYCHNTIGSFVCTCQEGFRKLNTECIDINECTDSQHDCEQLCVNRVPFYTCECYDGYNKTENTCTKIKVSDVCNSTLITCDYGCRDSSGVAECFCRAGMQIDPANKSKCIDIDECKEKICSQGCSNTVGSYECSCYPGYVLSTTDMHYCEACPENKYGMGCNMTCNCRGRGKSCDKVKGCICQDGWAGEECELDVDECTVTPRICPGDQTCANTYGSYNCVCPVGYELFNGTCKNFDECANLLYSNCSQICLDSPGSYRCQCRDGYILETDGNCTDIDECLEKTSGCEQECVNVVGSFNCDCRPGYVLNDDRKTCRKVADPCENTNITCQQGCSITEQMAQCFCNSGYVLGTDSYSCLDIHECDLNGTERHKCSDVCTNTAGSYDCSCPIGKALLLDKRTCEVCDNYHWGTECSNECGCYPVGSERCDPVAGCICKPGWAGGDCKQDVNECGYKDSPCPQSMQCVNTPGSYYCQCAQGYKEENSTCIDINECDLGVCEQNCTNTPGSYLCSCFKAGFYLNGTQCMDIDECTNTLLNNCDQRCRNTLGGFACECLEGYSLNTASRSTCDLINATNGCRPNSTSCNQLCSVNSSGLEVCSCHPGYHLNSNNTCIDIDECSPNPCLNGSCSNMPGYFTCECKVGYKLADAKTCQVCAEGYYGVNCSSQCTCIVRNTESCSATDGTCQCRAGWEGQDCSKDIDECLKSPCYANSQCVNSPGSHRCVCKVGYYSTGDNCSVCDSTRYGQDCGSACHCNFANTLACNHIDGQCNCKHGWTGDRCDQDLDECSTNSSYCSGSFTRCVNVNGSAECRCEMGYEKATTSSTCEDINECLNPLLSTCPNSLSRCKNTVGAFRCICIEGFKEISGTCTACDNIHYGLDCASTCSCNTTNTADCNDVNGTCTCKPGWTGTNCDVDIDECATKASYCSSSVETCHNLIGSAECLCNVGYYRPTTGATCQACDSTHFGQNCTSTCSCNTTNTADCNDVNGTCTCKPGWVGTTCNQACETNYYGLNCAFKCTCVEGNSLQCNKVNGSCECNSGWSEADCSQPVAAATSNKDLIIGLSVGLPLFVLLLAVVAIVLCLCLRRRRTRRSDTPTEQWESPFRSIIAPRLNPKGSWGTPSVYSPDGFSDAASSTGSMDGQLIKTMRSRDSAYLDTTRHNAEAANQPGVSANFSWDYMFNILQDHKDFEIQRPIIEETPNPAFLPSGKEDDSHA